jgi:hypothetical protein
MGMMSPRSANMLEAVLDRIFVMYFVEQLKSYVWRRWIQKQWIVF